jgi:hypothetical protein
MSEHQPREKFATQVDSALLADLRSLAKSEGRQLQSLVEEAIGNLLQQRSGAAVDLDILRAYQSTVERYASVYEKLAK